MERPPHTADEWCDCDARAAATAQASQPGVDRAGFSALVPPSSTTTTPYKTPFGTFHSNIRLSESTALPHLRESERRDREPPRAAPSDDGRPPGPDPDHDHRPAKATAACVPRQREEPGHRAGPPAEARGRAPRPHVLYLFGRRRRPVVGDALRPLILHGVHPLVTTKEPAVPARQKTFASGPVKVYQRAQLADQKNLGRHQGEVSLRGTRRMPLDGRIM